MTRSLHNAHKKQPREFTVTARNLTLYEAKANCETLSCSLFGIWERLSASLVIFGTEKFSRFSTRGTGSPELDVGYPYDYKCGACDMALVR